MAQRQRPKQPATAGVFTTEFHRAFEEETSRLLRKRFMWFCALVTITIFINAGVRVAIRYADTESETALREDTQFWTTALKVLLSLTLFGTCFVISWARSLTREQLLRLTFLAVVGDGMIRVLHPWITNAPDAYLAISNVLVTHFLACLFLPWTPVQAIRPLIPILVLNAALVIFDRSLGWVGAFIAISFSPVVGVPGTLICWLRLSQRTQSFKVDFLQRRYGQIRQDLSDARRIHESLFPPAVTTGPVRVAYVYEPMRGIGGDFLYVHPPRPGHPADGLSLLLLDVTGHGIAAALTVNRLHGELDRLFAERPDISPGEVLTDLNRYVHLTLATHSIYLTAFCCRVLADEDAVEYASAGHPPAFLLAADGTLDALPATSFVLGAAAGDDFQPMPERRRFTAGDALVAYTDGAMETRSESGKMLGIAGLQRYLASQKRPKPGQWPQTLLGHVDTYRAGPPHDDTLVVEVYRPVDRLTGGAAASPASQNKQHGGAGVSPASVDQAGSDGRRDARPTRATTP